MQSRPSFFGTTLETLLAPQENPLPMPECESVPTSDIPSDVRYSLVYSTRVFTSLGVGGHNLYN